MAAMKKKKKTRSKTRKQSSAATADQQKDGFPTLKQMRVARDDFAQEVGAKILTLSKAKELPKAMGLRASGDFVDALAKKVYMDVFKAAKRCVSNDRKTIRPQDL